MKFIKSLLWIILSFTLNFIPSFLPSAIIILYIKLFSGYGNNFTLKESMLKLEDNVAQHLNNINEYIILLIFLTIAVSVLAIYLSKKIVGNTNQFFNFKGTKDKKQLLLLAKVSIIFFISITLMNVGINWSNQLPQETSNVFLLRNSLFITALYLGILVPIKEEIIFRGLIFSSVENKFSPFIAFIVSSILFGLMHFQGISIASVYYIVVAFLLGFLRLKTKTLWASTILHIINNLIGVVVAYYELL